MYRKPTNVYTRDDNEIKVNTKEIILDKNTSIYLYKIVGDSSYIIPFFSSCMVVHYLVVPVLEVDLIVCCTSLYRKCW